MASSYSYNSTTGSDIAKAGWLYRQSTVLKRWKRNWFTLDRLGDLRYFESSESPKAEERIVVRAHVTSIKCGHDCRRHDPPDGLTIATAGFLELFVKDKDTMVLCAESFDDAKAWQVAVEQARSMPVAHNMYNQPVPTYVSASPMYGPYVPPYTPYGPGPLYSQGYPGQVLSTVPATQQVIQTPNGQTTIVQAPPQQVIVVDDDPYRYRYRYGYGRCRRNFWW